MLEDCTHVEAVRDVTPSALGCEECLKIGSHGCICDCAAHVAMSVLR